MPNIVQKKPKCKLDNLPLFGWAIEHQRKALSYPAVYLAGKYHLNPTQAAFYAEEMGLEATNDNP